MRDVLSIGLQHDPEDAHHDEHLRPVRDVQAVAVMLDAGREGRGGGRNCVDDGHGDVEHQKCYDHTLECVGHAAVSGIEVGLGVPQVHGSSLIFHDGIIGDQAHDGPAQACLQRMHAFFVRVDERRDPEKARHELENPRQLLVGDEGEDLRACHDYFYPIIGNIKLKDLRPNECRFSLCRSLIYIIIASMRKEDVYDNYGFKTKAVTLAIEAYLSDPQKDQERLDAWQAILKGKMETEEERQRLREEVRKGVPDKLRPQVWMQLITPPLREYESFVVKEELKEIDRDINRTIPTNKREEELKERLRHMLNVLAVAFPSMGYCQGLNFITANFLVLLDDKQAFNAMYHILYWQGHAKLMSDLNRIHTKLYVLDRLIRKHYPQLARCLDKLEVSPMLYASSWFITLFNNALPCPYIFRIMEVYMLEGEKILYRVALQILKEKKRVIKMLDAPEDVIAEIKNCEEFNKARIDKFFHDMFLINLSRKEIQTYEAEFADQKMPK